MSPLEAKLVAIVVVTLGSLLFGAIPAFLSLGRRFQRSSILSAVLCFGGGVLFATSIVHILPDVRNDMPKWSELIFCLGFLLIFLLDSIISYFNGSNQHSNSSSEESLVPKEQRRNYGAVDFGAEPSVSFHGAQCQDDEGPPANVCMNIGLLIAFTVHSLLEGLVIGIQEKEYGVLLLLGAVCSHKLLVAFCLGAEILADGRPWQSLICPLTVFICGSDLGIFIGMIFQVDELSSLHSTVPLLEGLAGGTLLYIALCEIVPRERKRELPGYGSLLQFVAFFIGFAVMSAITLHV